MEIVERKVTQEKLKLSHTTDKYIIEYDVILDENKNYSTINGTVKYVTTKEIVGYINKGYEFSIRMTNKNEGLLPEMSCLAVETLALLDDVIKGDK